MRQLDVALGLEVEEHLALVHVPGDVADRDAVDVGRDAAAQRAVLDAGALDVDDVGAQRAEVHRRPGPDHDQRQVENANAFERSSHRRLRAESYARQGEFGATLCNSFGRAAFVATRRKLLVESVELAMLSDQLPQHPGLAAKSGSPDSCGIEQPQLVALCHGCTTEITPDKCARLRGMDGL